MVSSLVFPLLALHGAWRWIVLAAAVACIGKFGSDTLRRAQWSRADRQWALAFIAALDIQLAIGLTLIAAVGNAGAAVHAGSMLAAVGIAHAGNVAVKRASPTDGPRVALLFFSIALLVIIAAIPWSHPLLRVPR